MPEDASVGHRSPIFIGGIAGTGKTRLGARLAGHPHISVTRRTYLWRDFYGRFGDLREPRNRSRCLDAVLASSGVRALNIDPKRVRSEFAQRPPSYTGLFALVHRHHATRHGKPRWCDQLGLVEAYARPIFETLPDAKMIHMVSDPRGPTLAESRPGRVGWMVGKWLTSAELATRNSEQHGERYLVLRHEELLADEEATLRAVCAFIDEPYDPSMMSRPRSTTEGSDLGSPPDTSRHRFIETRARRLMASHGYIVDGLSARAKLPNALVDWPADRVAFEAWRRVRARSIARQAAMRP